MNNNNYQNQSVLSEWVLRKLDGSMTDQQRAELYQYLEAHPEAIESYVDLTLLYSCLSEKGSQLKVPAEPLIVSGEAYSEALNALAEYELQALPQEVEPAAKPKPEIITSISKPVSSGPGRVNKFSLFTAVASLAALLLMIAYVTLFPVKKTREAVAQVTDSVGVKWANPAMSADVGNHLNNFDGPRHLLKGCVKIEFYTGAEVIIEGPAEFELKSFESMYLSYGRVYATVPTEASGFTVNTPCSSIVDIGTEFGVKVDFDGTSDLHMFKGRASMAAGINDETHPAREVVKGQALRVDPSTEQMQAIQVSRKMFARHIASDHGMVWRGEAFDLISLAAGGDGISKPGFATSIDPRTGLQVQRLHDDRNVPNTYVPVPWNKFVDGVFVPNGNQTQVVTSQGHAFAECPVTNGVFCSDLTMNMSATIDDVPMVLDGVRYGRPGKPGLFIHANLGITYDLERIRAVLPADSELIFRSKIGVSEEETPRDCNADFWVLVDGQIQYQKRNITTKGLCDQIEIRLRKSDRFLTLMTSDGGDPDIVGYKDGGRATDSDWCIFAEPVIDIE